MKVNSLFVVLPVSGLLVFGGLLYAEKKPALESGRETVAKPLTDKERRKREEKLRKELEGPYRKWLNEDVGYIITDEERQAFKRLANDDERQSFIENFWLRRDPSPILQKTNIKKNTTGASPTQTNALPRVFRDGKRIAAGSISLSAHPLRSSRILQAVRTSGPSKKAAVPRQRFPSKSGGTAISRGSATTL